MDNYLFTPKPIIDSKDVMSPMIRFLKYAGLEPANTDKQENTMASQVLHGVCPLVEGEADESTSLTKMIVICTVRTEMDPKYCYGTSKTTEYADRINYKSMTSKKTFNTAQEEWTEKRLRDTKAVEAAGKAAGEAGEAAGKVDYLDQVKEKLNDVKYN